MVIKPIKTDSKGLRHSFRIDLSRAEINRRAETRLAQLAQTTKMAGFRKGKVPAATIKIHYGRQARTDSVQALLDEAVRKIIASKKLNIATNPALTITKYEEAGKVSAEVVIETMPDFAKLDLTRIAIAKPSLTISDGEIDKAVANLADNQRPKIKPTPRRPAQNGDVLVIDFVGRIDGKPFDGGTAKQQQFILGGGGLLPDFEKGLLGSNAGEKRQIEVQFPPDHRNPELAGKDAVFAVTIKSVLEFGEPPAVNDDFARSLGVADVATLRQAISHEIHRQHAPMLRTLIRTRILDALDKVSGRVAIPHSIYKREYASICRQFSGETDEVGDGEAATPSKAPRKAPDKTLSTKEKAAARKLATRRVKLGILLSEIGRAHNITVTARDREQAIQLEAQRYPDKKKVIAFYRQNPKAVDRLSAPILEDKVMAYILTTAKVTDRPITSAELYKQGQG